METWTDLVGYSNSVCCYISQEYKNLSVKMQNTNSGAQKKQPSGFWLVLMKNLAQQRPQPLAVGLASKYLDDSKYFESR